LNENHSAFPEDETPLERPAPRRLPIKTSSLRPLVTFSLLGACVGVFMLQLVSKSMYGIDLPAALGAKVNEFIIQGQFWRLFTPMFLHGSILHLGFNMYALFSFGPGLERYYGHGRFLALYLISGFAGNVASFIFTANPSLGSSTAIFGLLGAEGVFLYQNRSMFGEVARRALSQIIMIALVNFVIGLQPGIDNWGHLGGLVGGSLIAWFGGPLLRVEGVYPDLSVVDGRSRQEVWLSNVIVFALFVILAGMVILLRSG